jgi:O-antigen/teichoic acid export membrane protein
MSGRRFVVNVAWNWATAVLNILTAIILTPFVLRKLGEDHFGLWAFTVSLAEYYWIMDFGFRSATIRYAAHYSTTGEKYKVNEILNTALFYSACVGPLILLGNFFVLPLIFTHTHARNPLFLKLITVVVGAWVLGSLFNVFTGGLEGFQRFDIVNRITLTGSVVRSAGTAILLWMGYGVYEMALMTLASQVIIHLLSFLAFRHVFPELRFSRGFVKLAALRTMLAYGSHSVVASIAQRVVSQSAPLIIGYFLPLKFVGYYASPSRLLDYTVDGIRRIGQVANPNAAAMVARNTPRQLVNLAVVANRYGLAIYLPLTIFLLVYSTQLLTMYLNPAFALASAPVLMVLAIGVTIALAGQYNSGSILFGIGRHQTYSKSLLVEAVALAGSLALVVPRFGVVGAAWVITGLMILNRCLFAALLMSRELKVGYFWFLARVYKPLLAAIPVGLLLYTLRVTALPGTSWSQLIVAGFTGVLCYAPLAFFFVLQPEHRQLLLVKVQERFGPDRFSRPREQPLVKAVV